MDSGCICIVFQSISSIYLNVILTVTVLKFIPIVFIQIIAILIAWCYRTYLELSVGTDGMFGTI